MILEAFALSLTVPVHKEADFNVDQKNRAQHDNEYAERNDARKQPSEQTEAPQQLRQDNQRSDWRGHPHFSKLRDAFSKTMTAEPAQTQLRAVSKKDDAKDDSQHERRPTTVCLE